MENNRNSIIAIALTVLVVLAWQFLYMGPRLEEQRAAQELAAQQQAVQEQTVSTNKNTGAGTSPGRRLPVAMPCSRRPVRSRKPHHG
nr:hypothetical protein [Marinicella sp. W31]MDC2876475.1 hypothetical protein [Marinicella sp. W31]